MFNGGQYEIRYSGMKDTRLPSCLLCWTKPNYNSLNPGDIQKFYGPKATTLSKFYIEDAGVLGAT
jgi:hypothetical protein